MSMLQIKANVTGGSVTVHGYRYFYYLANELACMALKDPCDQNAFRYAVGTVIMSFTAIETCFNHLLFSDPLRRLHNGMSDALRERLDRMNLGEKIEFSLRFQPGTKPHLLKTDREPYQSFDLLRQLRNLLVHYVPEEELVWSTTGADIEEKKLEKSLRAKFKFMGRKDVPSGDLTKAFLYRIVNRHCSRWAFESIAPFITSLCKALGIAPIHLSTEWKLDAADPK